MRMRVLCLLVWLTLATQLHLVTPQPCNVTFTPDGFDWTTDVTAYITMQSAASFVMCMDPGTYTGCGDGIEPYDDTHITLRGAGEGVTVLDCQHNGRLLHLRAAGSTMYISDLTMTRGSAHTSSSTTNRGGALLSKDGITIVERVTFSHNLADPAFATNAKGGAVYITNGGVVDFFSCTFYNNTAYSGGGVFTRQLAPRESYIVNCTFEANTATEPGATAASDCHGGALVVKLDSRVVVSTSVFVRNYASNYGGAVAMEGYTFQPAYVDVNDTLFTANTAGEDGGGVYAEEDGFVTVVGGSMVGNSAGRDGGGLFCYGLGNDLECSAVAVTFSANTAANDGGGLGAIFKTVLTVVDCAVAGNVADKTGGGLVCGAHAKTTCYVNNTVFEYNTARAGGGVAGYDDGVIHATNSVFDANTADSLGGGLRVTGLVAKGMVYTNLTVTRNYCVGSGGGVVFSGIRKVDLVDSLIEGNFGENDGGGVLCRSGGTCNVRDTLVRDNSGSNGGGLFCSASTACVLHSCSLTANVALDVGGGAACVAASCQFNSSVVSNNTAVIAGGVFAIASRAVVEVYNSYVATDTDVAVYGFVVGAVVIDSSSVIANSQSYALLTNGAQVVSITDSTILLAHPHADQGANTAAAAASVSSTTVSVTVTRSLLGSASAAPGLACSGSSVSLTSSVACANDGGTAALCQDGCVINGGDVTLCSATDECRETCGSVGFCVRDTGFFTGPNAGCYECDGECFAEVDNCTVNAACDDTPDFYTCSCETGYVGDGYTNCSDVNECAEGLDNCAPAASCTNTQGSYTCACNTGYVGSGSSCTDVNECGVGTDSCHGNATCVNTAGSFACVCLEDFYGNGQSCTACPTGTRSAEGSTTLANCVCLPGLITASGGSGGAACYLPTCSAGSYWYLPDVCLTCPPNTYSPTANADECTVCPPNSVSAPGSNSIDNCTCSTGYMRTPANTCVGSCTAGSYAPTPGVCVPCATGRYSTTNNATACASCPQFASTLSPGSDSPLDCVCVPPYIPASYGGGGGGGNFTSSGSGSGGGLVCELACGPGQYIDDEDCVACPQGYFSNATDAATECIACPVQGTTTVVVGATSPDNCTCEPGLAPEFVGGKWVCTVSCGPGTARPSIVFCEACGTGEYSDSLNQKSCTRCPANTNSPEGSQTRSECTCRPGYYNPKQRSGQACFACPTGAKCKGGTNAPQPLAGYAAYGSDATFVSCVPAEACLAAGKCAVGYEGEWCEACEPGYYRVSRYCRKCTGGTMAGTVFAVLGLVGVCGAIMYINLRSKIATTATALIIGINTIQVVSQFGRLNVAWPEIARKYYDVLSFANLNIELTAPECALGSGGAQSAFYVRFFTTMALPGLVAAVLVGYYSAGRVIIGIVGPRAPTLAELSRALIQSACQMALILYLPLSAAVFEFFDCVPTGVNGVLVLDSNPDVVCYDKKWWAKLGYAILFLFLYPLGIPAVFGGVLSHYVRVLSAPEFSLRFGFLTNRYRPEAPLYELVVLFRKLAVAVCLTFVTASPYIQAGATYAALLLGFVLHVSMQPFFFPRHNIFESVCYTTMLAVVASGITFQDSAVSDTFKNASMVLLLTTLMAAIVLAAAYDAATMVRESKAWSTHGAAPGVVSTRHDLFIVAREGRVSAGVFADVELDANGLDEFGLPFDLILSVPVYLQRDTGAEGLDRWQRLGSGLTTIHLARRYSDAVFFLRAESGDGTALFALDLMGDSHYAVVGPRTHEAWLSAGAHVAITFRTVLEAHDFVDEVAHALPSEYGLLSGVELYELQFVEELRVRASSAVSATRMNNDTVAYDDGGTNSETAAGRAGHSPRNSALTAFYQRKNEATLFMEHCVAAVRAAGIELPLIESGELEFVGQIGRGGFGSVELCRHGGVRVAVKIKSHAAEVRSFVEEAAQLHALNHPNIVRLRGVCPAMLALVTEYVEGHDLSDCGAALAYPDKLLALYSAAKALVYMHEVHNMAHRDVKPANILVGAPADGRGGRRGGGSGSGNIVKLADLGLAGDASLAKGGYTERYGAPEQIDSVGGLPGDVYSFGVTIFETLTGKRPFTSGGRVGRDKRCRPDVFPAARGSSDYDPQGLLTRELSRLIESVVERGMWAYDPYDRPHMRFVLVALARCVAHVCPDHGEAVEIVADYEAETLFREVDSGSASASGDSGGGAAVGGSVQDEFPTIVVESAGAGTIFGTRDGNSSVGGSTAFGSQDVVVSGGVPLSRIVRASGAGGWGGSASSAGGGGGSRLGGSTAHTNNAAWAGSLGDDSFGFGYEYGFTEAAQQVPTGEGRAVISERRNWNRRRGSRTRLATNDSDDLSSPSEPGHFAPSHRVRLTSWDSLNSPGDDEDRTIVGPVSIRGGMPFAALPTPAPGPHTLSTYSDATATNSEINSGSGKGVGSVDKGSVDTN